MNALKNKPLISTLMALTLASPLLAHTGQEHHSILDAFAHPFLGVDHLLAMLAVGLLAVKLKTRWLPAFFLGGMAVGMLAPMMGIKLAVFEIGITSSVLFFGALLIWNQARIPLCAAAVGAFAMFHGHAHGAELGGMLSPVELIGSVLAGTAVLHGVGWIGGTLLQGRLGDARAKQANRVLGLVFAAAGAFLMAG